MLKASGLISIPSQTVLKVVKYGYIRQGTNLTLKDSTKDTKHIRKDIAVWDKLQRVYTDCNLGSTKAKRFSVLLVYGEANILFSTCAASVSARHY